ncbi:MAG: IPT/TIG domain-containing protein, partial [Candidatus Cryptobacteroides sp.]
DPFAATEGKAELKITDVSPKCGKAPDVITIVGSGFSMIPSENKVTINGEPLIPVQTSITMLKCKLTYNPKGKYPVVIKVGDKEFTGPEFEFEDGPAFFFEPLIGEGGTQVTLSGSSFSDVLEENTVTIGGKPAEILSASRTKIVVKVPYFDEGEEYKFVVSVVGKEDMESEENFKYGEMVYDEYVEKASYIQANCLYFVDDSNVIFGSYSESHPFHIFNLQSLKVTDWVVDYDLENKRCTELTLNEEDGMVYGAFPKSDKVGWFDPMGSAVTFIDFVPEILSPVCVRFDAQGNMYVASSSDKTCYRIAAGTTDAVPLFDFKDLSCPEGEENGSDIITFDFDWDGNFIVALQYCGLWRVSPDGNTRQQLLLGKYPGEPAVKTGDTFSEITAITVDRQRKDIYLNDAGAKTIMVARLAKGVENAEVLSVSDGFIPYGMKFSPSRDGLYCGARWHHDGAIIKIPISFK